MTEQLIKIIENSKVFERCGCHYNDIEHFVNQLACYLIDNGVIVLPCKVGNTVYCVKNTNIVEYNVLDAGREGFIVNLGDVYLSYYEYSEVGESVFLTREEAENALRKGE